MELDSRQAQERKSPRDIQEGYLGTSLRRWLAGNLSEGAHR